MFKVLGPGAIGIRGFALPAAIKLAQKTGFQGLEVNIKEVAALVAEKSTAYVMLLFEEADIVPSHWGLPVAWRDEDRWKEDLTKLPAYARLAQEMGCIRTATWCPPASDIRKYAANFDWHKHRFGAIAEVLSDYGCSLGIEFIGPQTLRDGHRHPFIYTLEGMMELASAIGTGNVGLLLDAWHLYTSGGDMDVTGMVTAEDVVLVHVNDAPTGVERHMQIDSQRCLPLETGVVDAPTMLRALAALGYVGPVMVEPFSQTLNAVAQQNAVDAARMTINALNRLWTASGLS
jgi:sugar phosphate isomerase/epimerase